MTDSHTGGLTMDEVWLDAITKGPEPGQMIIWEQALAHLEEELAHLEHRAQYYGAHTFSQAEFVELLRTLKAKAAQIRKTNQGEG